MGAPKAMLTLEGETFLGRVVAAMRAGGCDAVVVVTGPPTDADAAQIADHARGLGAAVAVNPDRESEQVASIRVALEALSGAEEGIVVSPVDAPSGRGEVVAALLDALRDGAPVAVPIYEGRRGHPIAFGREAFADLEDPALPMGARSVLQRHAARIAEIDLSDPGILLDIDTPEQYERLRKVSE